MMEPARSGSQTHADLLRFRAAMDGSGDAIYLVDRASMRFVDVNATACARMGYSREELLQMGPQDLLNATREQIERLYDATISAGTGGTTSESTARTRDGRVSTTELHRRALCVDGEWIIVSIARDITQRKCMEQALLDSEERFRLTFELAGSGIANVDLEGRFQHVNRSLCDMLGYGAAELVGRSVKTLSHPEDRNSTDLERARVRAGEIESMHAHKRYLHKNGATVWVHLSVALVRGADGSPRYEIAVFDDETERRKAEIALYDSIEKLRVFTDNVPVMTASWDENLRCSFANRHFARFYGAAVGDLLGKHVRDIIGADVYAEAAAGMARALQGHPVTYQRTRASANGPPVHLEVKLLPNTGDDGRVQGLFSVTTDITEHKLTEERIRRVAHHDPLTGLPNRLLFNDRLQHAISRAKRDTGRMALLYLDLNKFKPVNDALGHSAGDELLRAVAQRIGALLRESDTLARVGGDEFTVILPDAARNDQAATVADKIVAALSAPFLLGTRKQAVSIGTSIGIALFPDVARDADGLVRLADAAMYRAKQADGPNYAFSAS